MIGKTSLRILLEGGIAVSLALLFSAFKIFQLPMGGEISLKSLPLIVYALRWGLKAGVLAGLTFGLCHFIQVPIMVHPVQFLLDYPLAGMALGCSGLLRGQKGKTGVWLGILLGQGLRFGCHFLSGLIFIKSFLPAAPDRVNLLGLKLAFTPAWYSLAYNLSYSLPETILCLLLLPPILKALRRGE